MGWLSKMFSGSSGKNSDSYTMRFGKMVKTDKVFDAWTSGNLKAMIQAEGLKTNPIDRHLLLLNIVKETYKLRKEDKYRTLCIKYADKHLREFPDLYPFIRKDLKDFMPRVPTFQQYATLLTEDKKYAEAINVCENAIQFGLDDGTKNGFEGRIERIKKKMKKVNG